LAALQPYLDAVNVAPAPAPRKVGKAFSDAMQEWREQIAVRSGRKNRKPSRWIGVRCWIGVKRSVTCLSSVFLERAMGIEPTSEAWEAVLSLERWSIGSSSWLASVPANGQAATQRAILDAEWSWRNLEYVAVPDWTH